MENADNRRPREMVGKVPPLLPMGVLRCIQGSETPPLRGRSLGQTFRLALPLAAEAGLTRFADITGLDRVGIPVVSAIRPNAKSFSVSSGKGANVGAAWVSAIMEAIELYFAESATASCRYDELPAGTFVPDPTSLPRARGAGRLQYDQPDVEFSLGIDLTTDQEIAVPFDLVHAQLKPDWFNNGQGFLVSTNGIGSGNDRCEAALHAVCEVIERDAVAIMIAKDPQLSMRSFREIDLETVSDRDCQDLIARCHAAGLQLYAYDITSDIGVPTIYCRLRDLVFSPFAYTDGAGSHPCSAVALRRAITEAAQTRLTVISGSRDDLAFSDYSLPGAQRSSSKSKEQEPIALRRDLDGPSSNVKEALCWVLSRLETCGFGTAVCVDLGSRSGELCFVRVVIPGLEGSTHSRYYQPGRRALLARNGACAR